MTSPKFKAVIFDMDGVLIDSEPSWQEAEFQTMKRLGLPISYEDTLQTTGLRIDQVVSYWYQRFPWANYDNEQTAKTIVDQVVNAITSDGQAMTGVESALEFCRTNDYKIGLATSSSNLIIEAVLNKLNIAHYFDAIESAEHLAYGKPHPEVYLNCAKAINLDPITCVAIEDSFNGLVAARAANMQTIAIPAVEQQDEPKWVIAHQQLKDLTELPEYLDSSS
ncbi:haloacid dehalogenase superfamily protein, subfamily IA, variant 3 with third motif having DD or ED [Shewanella psychrophila]|uniref:Haloacid dehalogenase superfamily protein, subfamily IA, variant 3 with third motif having DD or ED n=1 Tax=Shewanella psychrophila TaxID=225848 RepID=A0A1S6HY55_9GAMM|nr:hexitol phosphatase HxpB [Shewanella psychrophila]AQS40441.1 haloacid dehalogenase superfamily protein, subfamily IA, variant 3 with third motif having DD or ED [Shewanella psychrophila]